MQAIVLTEDGAQLAEVDRPQIKPTQILVKVASCSVNRSDLLTTQGQNFGHVGGDAKVMGASFCGEVVEVGDAAQNFAVGDRVMGQGAAGWAEYAASDWRRALPIPADDMDYIEAATLMGSVLTMHDAIVTNGKFAAGQTILIQGASSGVGLMGMQIGKHLGAKLVIGTSTNPERRARLSEYGADLALDSGDDNWVEQVLEATDGRGVDLIVDNISGYVANANMAATAVHGTIINVGRLGGMTAEMDLNKHAERRLTYIGTTGRTRSIEEHAEVVRRAHEDLWDAVGARKLTMPVDRVFDLSESAAALEHMAANAHFGRIILKVGA
ncbi:MAG: zinc-binding dehydrogenase [Alphaproteobacteria bacterium]|nr:zinc-binding dehydrogenase [Alphaproteobacteria bacterium]